MARLSFLKLALFRRRGENASDGFALRTGSGASLFYEGGIGHPGRLLLGIVGMHRSEVVGMASFHLISSTD